MGMSYRSLLLAPIALAAAAMVYLSFGAWIDITFPGILGCLGFTGNCGDFQISGTSSHRVLTFIADGYTTAVLGFTVLLLTSLALLYPEWDRHLLRFTTGAGLLAMAVAARVAFDTLQHRTAFGESGYGLDHDQATTGLYALIALGAAVAILSVAALVMQPRNEELTEYEEWA